MNTLKLYRWLDKDSVPQTVIKLNELARQLYDLFNRGINVDGHLNAQLVTVAFQGPQASLSIKTKYTSPPIGVIMLKLIDKDSGDPVEATWSWQYSQDGYIKTTSFSSLASGNYEVRVLILGG